MTDAPFPVDTRAARLAAALRANLHKRKAQARAARGDARDRPEETSDQPDQ